MDVTCVIVDNNDRFLEAARAVLADDGVIVVGVASTSAEAMARVGMLRPDVVLIDICLGEESGFALAERVARARSGPHPVIILISTYTATDFDDMAQGFEAHAFLPKSDLSGQEIRMIMRGEGHRAPAPAPPTPAAPWDVQLSAPPRAQDPGAAGPKPATVRDRPE